MPHASVHFIHFLRIHLGALPKKITAVIASVIHRIANSTEALSEVIAIQLV